jgi:hypothetical protein
MHTSSLRSSQLCYRALPDRHYIALAAYRDSPPRLRETRTGQCLGGIGEACRGRPSCPFLSFSFFSVHLPQKESCSKVPWPGGRGGGIPFLCGVERASQPGMAPGKGGWRGPRASDSRRMSCVRILAQRVWSTCRVQALLVPCRVSCLGSDGGFLVRVPTRAFRGRRWHYVEVR